MTALFQAIEDGNRAVIEDLFAAYAIDINKQNFEANVSLSKLLIPKCCKKFLLRTKNYKLIRRLMWLGQISKLRVL